VGFHQTSLRAQSEDLALMFKWFDSTGYAADIKSLRRDFPEVTWHTSRSGHVSRTGVFSIKARAKPQPNRYMASEVNTRTVSVEDISLRLGRYNRNVLTCAF